MASPGRRRGCHLSHGGRPCRIALQFSPLERRSPGQECFLWSFVRDGLTYEIAAARSVDSGLWHARCVRTIAPGDSIPAFEELRWLLPPGEEPPVVENPDGMSVRATDYADVLVHEQHDCATAQEAFDAMLPAMRSAPTPDEARRRPDSRLR